MKNRKLTIAVATLVAIVIVVSLLFASRQWVARQSFMSRGRGLTAKLTPQQKQKYGEDLKYTLDTFWKFYEKGLVSRNDLNDVVDKMAVLRDKKEIKDMDIFDFIGYVSRLYTEAMRRHQKDMFPE